MHVREERKTYFHEAISCDGDAVATCRSQIVVTVIHCARSAERRIRLWMLEYCYTCKSTDTCKCGVECTSMP